MEIFVEFIDHAVFLEGPRQNESDKTADLGATIEEFDRHIGIFAKRGVADRSVNAKAEVAIAQEIMLDDTFNVSGINIDTEAVFCR